MTARRRENLFIGDLIQADPETWRTLFLDLRSRHRESVTRAHDLRRQEQRIKWLDQGEMEQAFIARDAAMERERGLSRRPGGPLAQPELSDDSRERLRELRIVRKRYLNRGSHAERMRLRSERDEGSAIRRRQHLVLSMLRGRGYTTCEPKAKTEPLLGSYALIEAGVPEAQATVLAERLKEWSRRQPTATTTEVHASA